MSATIRSTVETALSNAGVSTSGYTSYINTVVAALEEREFGITETIVDETAANFRVSKEQVTEQVKAKTALEFRPIPEPVVEVPAVEEEAAEEADSEGATKSGGKGKRIAVLEKAVADIQESINKLTTLAERHLGA